MHTVDFGADISWLNRHDAPLRQAPCRKYLHISLELIRSSRLLRPGSPAGPLARDARSEEGASGGTRSLGELISAVEKNGKKKVFPRNPLFPHCRFTRGGLGTPGRGAPGCSSRGGVVRCRTCVDPGDDPESPRAVFRSGAGMTTRFTSGGVIHPSDAPPEVAPATGTPATFDQVRLELSSSERGW